MSMKFAFLKLALLLAALTFFVAPVLAHDIPRDVTVQMFFKPEGQTLRVLMRVPLKGIMDIEFPHRERGAERRGGVSERSERPRAGECVPCAGALRRAF